MSALRHKRVRASDDQLSLVDVVAAVAGAFRAAFDGAPEPHEIILASPDGDDGLAEARGEIDVVQQQRCDLVIAQDEYLVRGSDFIREVHAVDMRLEDPGLLRVGEGILVERPDQELAHL